MCCVPSLLRHCMIMFCFTHYMCVVVQFLSCLPPLFVYASPGSRGGHGLLVALPLHPPSTIFSLHMAVMFNFGPVHPICCTL